MQRELHLIHKWLSIIIQLNSWIIREIWWNLLKNLEYHSISFDYHLKTAPNWGFYLRFIFNISFSLKRNIIEFVEELEYHSISFNHHLKTASNWGFYQRFNFNISFLLQDSSCFTIIIYNWFDQIHFLI